MENAFGSVLENGFQTCLSSEKKKVIFFMSTIGNKVIKIILRALTGMLSNSHPALQRTPTDWDWKCWWWRMKDAFSGQRDGSYSCHTHTHTHTHTCTHLYSYLSVTNNNPQTQCTIMKCAPVSSSYQSAGWGAFIMLWGPWGIISTYHTR